MCVVPGRARLHETFRLLRRRRGLRSRGRSRIGADAEKGAFEHALGGVFPNGNWRLRRVRQPVGAMERRFVSEECKHSAPRHATFPPIGDGRAEIYWSRTTTLSAAPVASVTVSRTKPGPSGAKNSVRADFFAGSGMPLRSTLRGGVPPAILMAIGSGASPSLPVSSRLAPLGGKTMRTFAAATSPKFAAD